MMADFELAEVDPQSWEIKALSAAGIAWCNIYICKSCGYEICASIYKPFHDLTHFCARCKHGKPLSGKCLFCRLRNWLSLKWCK